MSKRKINELNEIIDTAYVVADDSYDNGYNNRRDDRRDNRDDNMYIKRDDSTNNYNSVSVGHDNSNMTFGNMSSNTQSSSRFGNTSNHTNIFRSNGGNGGNGGNIFLKNKSCEYNDTNNTSNTNNKKDSDKIVLNDDNFPSLVSKSVKPNNVVHKLDFKKIVEKKPVIIISKPEEKITNTMQYRKLNSSHYSLYQEVKEKSEHIARIKMVNDVLSDDDDNIYNDNDNDIDIDNDNDGGY